MRKIIILGAALMLAVCLLSTLTKKPTETATDKQLETLIACIDGVDSAAVAFYYAQDESPLGIAVVYHGQKSSATDAAIYELVSALYGLPYSRIYVS